MHTFLIVVHILVTILLIAVILIQKGKGGGLVESFSSAESLLGTQTNQFLARATTVLTVIFFIVTISLAYLSVRKHSSLMESWKPAEEAAQESTEEAPVSN